MLTVLVASFLISWAGPGVKCSGYCTNDPQKCKARGGRITGLCTNLLACCDPLIPPAMSCGDVATGQSIVYFKSPRFPYFSSGDLNCDVKIEIQKDTIATRIDFIEAEMDGLAFAASEDNAGSCESDMIFIRGLNEWAPSSRCGNLSGYSFLIDRDSLQTKGMQKLSIVALMASPAYRWHIRVVQVSKRKHSFGENSVEDYEIRFRNKRALLNPSFRETDDNNNSLSFNDSVFPSEKMFTSDYDVPLDSLEIPLILYGEDTVISSAPWQVSFRIKQDDSTTVKSSNSIKLNNNTLEATEQNAIKADDCQYSEGFHFCGGSIISERYIVSAAHCFYGTSKLSGMLNISSIKAVVGDTNLCTDDSELSGNNNPSFDYNLESVILHYAYDSQLLINDIALIKLKSPIKFYDHIKAIKMSKLGDDFSNKEALVTGWGDTDAKKNKSFSTNSSSTDLENDMEFEEQDDVESPNILQMSRKFIIQNQTICNEKDLEEYPTSFENVKKHKKYLSVFDSTVCTLGKIDNDTNRPVSTGKGDSGGPLVLFDSEGNPILVGVVSYGVASEPSGCGRPPKDNRTFDYFASIPFYRSWIDLTMLSFDNVPLKG